MLTVAASQIFGALVNKTANWYVYRSAWGDAHSKRLRFKVANWLIEQFWLDVMGLHPNSLRKSHVNVYSKYSEKKRVNRLPHGTVKIVVNRTHVVQSIYGSIQEYAGFERPAWLE